jgi:hypothetical protein
MDNRNIKFTMLIIILLSLVTIVERSMATEPDIVGVMGMDLADEVGYMAIRVEVPEGMALNEILWYNNDSQVVYPKVLAGTGFVTGPGIVDNAVTVAEQVVGASSRWSSVIFDEPVGATHGALYVMFEFPGDEFIDRGEGGGPAIGYGSEASGSTGWISGDGEVWSRLNTEFGFSIMPLFVPYTEGMVIKSLDGVIDEVKPEPVVEKLYLAFGPNPFNPKTEIRFGLPQASMVKLDIYDLRGRKMARLVDDFLENGHHSVSWYGKDTTGRNVASGVYFMKLKVNAEVLTQRLTLIR